MERDELTLLRELWAEANLAFMHDSAGVLIPERMREVLRELNERHGEELVRHQQAKLEVAKARRASLEGPE